MLRACAICYGRLITICERITLPPKGEQKRESALSRRFAASPPVKELLCSLKGEQKRESRYRADSRRARINFDFSLVLGASSCPWGLLLSLGLCLLNRGLSLVIPCLPLSFFVLCFSFFFLFFSFSMQILFLSPGAHLRSK